MTVLSLVMALSIGLIQSASAPINSITESHNVEFATDFQRIRSLSQAKDSARLVIFAASLKTKWKDVDMDRYCRLLYQLLGRLRTDFDPVDYGKLKELSDDVLSDLEKKLDQGIDPVLVPHYCKYQIGYVSLTYGTKYYYTQKADKKDEVWLNQRKEIMTHLLKAWKLLQEAKDPTWDINMKMPSMNVDPLDGGPSGGSPDAIVDPEIRTQYVAEIQRVAGKHKWWGIQYNLWKTERDLGKSLVKDIQAMYKTPPLAPDELKSLLDTYVKDEEQKKMFLEASQK